MYKNIGKANFSNLELLIKNLPINKKAEKIEVKNDESKGNEIEDPRIKEYFNKPNFAYNLSTQINNSLKGKERK